MKTVGYILVVIIAALMFIPSEKELKERLNKMEKIINERDSIAKIRESFIIDSVQKSERDAKNYVQESLKTLDSTILNIAKNERYLKYNK